MSATPPLAVTRDQVLAFRLGAHNLAKRLPLSSLLQAAGACGIQNTPPGSAAISLHARVADLTQDAWSRALFLDKTMLQLWSMRGSPYQFPTRDSAVFTLGLLPQEEESLRFFILGAEQALSTLGMSASEVVERTALALQEVLDNRVLTTKRQLDRELASRVALQLTAGESLTWQEPSPYGPNQSLGEALVSFALRPLALRGLIAFAHRQGNVASFVRTDQWLGHPLSVGSPDPRADLVQRYMHCYGPSVAEHFAEWAGVSPAQAAEMWRLVDSELVEVTVGRRTTWNRLDVPLLMSPSSPVGTRLLPPHDPFLALRDRAALIPDQAVQHQIWRQSGNPGVVLADGQVVGTWRPNTRSSRLTLTIELLASISERIRSECEAEAVALAPFRGCVTADVQFVSAT